MRTVRRAHVLRSNKSTTTPRFRIVVDTETEPVPLGSDVAEQRLVLGCASYQDCRGHGAELFSFDDDPGDFWDWVIAHIGPHQRVWVYAHNLANFDLAVLAWHRELVERRGFQPTKVIVGGPTVIDLKRGDRSIRLCDSTNFFATSLEALGTSIGIHKARVDFATASREELRAYCHQDVRVLREALDRYYLLIEQEDLGVAAFSLAGQAFAAYRHRFMDHPIHLHDNERALKLERNAYMGGRCEAFRLGEIDGPVHLLDFNSQYPAVMEQELYPAKLVRIVSGADLGAEGLSRLLQRFCLIARVDIRTEKPIVPYRAERLLYPVGDFTTTLCTPELRTALDAGIVVKVHEVAIYERAPLFKRFVTEMYALRQRFEQEGNAAFAYMVKILMNSLYGKFGQYNHTWEEVGGPALQPLSSEETADLEEMRSELWGLEHEEAGLTASIRLLWTQLRDAGAVYRSGKAISMLDEEGSDSEREVVRRWQEYHDQVAERRALRGKIRGLQVTICRQPIDTSRLKPGITEYIDGNTGEHITLRRVGGYVECRSAERVDGYNSFCAIAAHVTAYGRCLLGRAIAQSGPRNTLYVDTDSLFVTAAGYANLDGQPSLLHPTRLGALKEETTKGSPSKGMTIEGLKVYRFGAEWRRKGVRRDAVQVGPRSWQQVQFRGMLGAMRAHDLDRQLTADIVRTLSGVYQKGTVGADGWVAPLRL